MCITVIKEGNTLRVLSASEDFPEGMPVTLHAETPAAHLAEPRQALVAAQMPAFVRGDESERAEDLF